MPAMTPKESSETQSFLRTGPESALHIEAQYLSKEEAVRQVGDVTAFPAPDIDEDVCDRLNAFESFVGFTVRIDTPADAVDDSALCAAVETGLEQMTEDTAGLWFKWNSRLYGWTLPGDEAAEAKAVAQQFQALLAEQRVETVSIGISRFPLLDFDRLATMQNACKALDHAAFFGPGSIVVFDAVSLNISGDHYYQAGLMEEAIGEYKTALRLNPDDVNVHNSLGVCLAHRQDHDGARNAFNEVLRLAPGEAMAIFNIGMLDALAKDTEAALQRFEQAYAIDAETFEIPFQIGKLLTEQDAHEKAIPYLKAAMDLRDTHAPAFTLLGHCLAAINQPLEAIKAYKKAVKLNPNDAAALSALGTLYDQKGENPEICVTFCRQSVVLCPDDRLFRSRLARLYYKQNQLDAALAEYEAAAALGYDAEQAIAEIQEQLAGSNDKKQRCA